MIPVSDFIAVFETMLKEKWKYEWGAARKGCVDCSGAFVYASKKLGGPSISHSSNVIPRRNIRKLLPIEEAKPGYAVFRWSDKFETSALAKKYNDGLGNFKHIGLVSRDGKHVLEAKGSKYGFVETKLNSGWAYCGALSFIEYEEKTMGEAMFTHFVNVSEGSYLNVREDHATNKKRLGKLYFGDGVNVVDTYGNWSKIIWEDGYGWVYTKYLTALDVKVLEFPAEDVEAVEKFWQIQVVITDSAGNVFKPVGDFTTSFEFIEDDGR